MINKYHHFGPFVSSVTMALLLLQLICIDHSFLRIFVTLVIPSPCQIVGLASLWLIWSISLIVLWVIVMYVSDICREGIAYYIPLICNGFMDSLTRLVYLIIVPDGLFVSIIQCQFLYFSNHIYFIQIAHTYPYGQFNYCT